MTKILDTLDPGHLLPADEWDEVVREAEAIVRGEALKRRPLALGRSSFPSVDAFITARWGGGFQTPTFAVLHDAETPLDNGYALSISRMFSTTSVQKSAHFMFGPDAGYQLRDTGLLAWHCGNGNRLSVGVEQAGYARFTRAEWLTALGLQQLKRIAAFMRELEQAHGIGRYFMTDAQLLDAYNGRRVGGWATHNQCRRVLGGTTHTDPDPNYPYDVLLEEANGPAPVPSPEPILEEDMKPIRNSKGTVVLLADTWAEWVPTASDYTRVRAQFGPDQTYSDDFFNRLVTRARAAGAANTVSAMRSLARHHSDAVFAGHDGVDPEDPSTWPPTPTDDSDASSKA